MPAAVEGLRSNEPGLRTRCEWKSDISETGSTADLAVFVARSAPMAFRTSADEAMDSFSSQKKLGLSLGHTVDLAGFGHFAYAEVHSDQTRPYVIVSALQGGDVVTVSYAAAPSTDDLTLAGAAEAMRMVLAGLR